MSPGKVLGITESIAFTISGISFNSDAERVRNKSRAVEKHLKDWSDGASSGSKVGRDMGALVGDGMTHPAVLRMNSINSGGPKHCHNNLLGLMRNFGFDDLMLAMLNADLKVAVRPFAGYWLDIGRPDDYEAALEIFNDGSNIFLPDDSEALI